MANKSLRRYTDLPSLIYMLSNAKLTLLNPELWDDINDSYYLFRYKERKKLGSVLALCFTQAAGSYQHWKVFANSPGGVCVIFDRNKLLSSLKSNSKIRVGNVTYLTLKDIRRNIPKIKALPFVKRWAFKSDQEFRIIYHSHTYVSSHDIPISLDSISGILLSPWMHKNLSVCVSQLIRSIDGCRQLSIARSTVVENEEWKSIGAFATLSDQ